MKQVPELLPVRILGDDILRMKAREVEEITDEIRDFAADLVHTMYLRDGVGLAAPQVGKSIRMFAADPWWGRDNSNQNPLVLINPIIESSEGQSVNEEGCISVPDIFAEVVRPSAITISFTDLEGTRQTMDLKGFPAIVMQHEYDHLNGVLFIDKIKMLTRLTLLPRIKELERRAVDGVNIVTELPPENND
ncbi:MAG: peptide deformylase [Candidatus Cloacimonetes bacterium]|nr:peptide deformylase [Candidatus Cloacimonadota bacterium]